MGFLSRTTMGIGMILHRDDHEIPAGSCPQVAGHCEHAVQTPGLDMHAPGKLVIAKASPHGSIQAGQRQ